MKVTIQSAPLPTNFRGTPQQLVDALLERLEVVVDDVWTFASGDVPPSANEGPWLKGGKQIWVWDEDTSEYVPLDVSASVSDQIAIGEDEPDSDEYSLWLKLDGSTVLGLFYYAGAEAGWVQKASDLSPGSVQTVHLADESVTREKIKNGEVIAAKIQNDLPVSKLERGAAFQVLRMDSDASTARWSNFIEASTEIPFATSSWMEVDHGLGLTPRFVHPVLVCKETDLGWAVGDEVDLTINHTAHSSDYTNPTHEVYRNDTKIGVRVPNSIRIANKGTGNGTWGNPTLSRWSLKIYYSAR